MKPIEERIEAMCYKSKDGILYSKPNNRELMMQMKWIEIKDINNSKLLVNVDHLLCISRENKSIVKLYSGDGSSKEIVFQSEEAADKQYDRIKSYIDYGPTPNGLTIESE